MSDSRYSYDDNAEVWPYFAITLTAVVLIPATISSFRTLTASESVQDQTQDGSADKLTASSRPHNYEDLVKFRRKERRKSIFSQANIAIALGWIAVAYFAHVIYESQKARANDKENKLFDPYEILGVSFSATEKQIKSVYRKLSLQLHPDKIRNLGNQTLEEIEARYVDITKAYKALTDETTRDNFLKYGHPDGPQQTSHGIALPKFLVEGKGSPVTIAIYSLFVGIALPYLVGSWWAGARTYTRTGIHQKTAADFFEACAKDQPHFVTYDRILDMLSKAAEYQLLLPAGSRNPAEIKKLLVAHLGRQPTVREADKLTVVARAPKILAGYLDIAAAFRDSGLCTRLVEVTRCIVQAVPIADQAYGDKLQIPGVSIASVSNKEAAPSKEALQFVRSTVPSLKLVKAFFRVPGENGIVPPQAQAHLVVKLAVLPPGQKLPANIPDELIADDDEEHHKTLQEPLSTNELDDPIPPVYAPYFPTSFVPTWYGFISGERDGKLIDGPAELNRLSYHNLSLSDKELGDGSKLTIGTFKIQLTTATPPTPGEFSFRLSLLSSGYFGGDVTESVRMKVENPPPVESPAIEDEDDISEPEEDSVAGAVQQLRGGGTKRAPADAGGDESSDEEEEDLSDIDTDTEDEAD